MKRKLFTVLFILLGYTCISQNPAVERNAFTTLNEAKGSSAKDILPNWTPISQHVTATDINGNIVNTQAILNAGKALVIDYSSINCSWCWVMHTHGILNAIHHQLGSDVEVLWVEADSSTGSEGIYGEGTAPTQGDWTDGGTVPYSIIDNPAFTNLIGGSGSVPNYPTVVFVSPTGYWCDLYATQWGFSPYDSTAAVSAVSVLLNTYPRHNQSPLINIEAHNHVVAGAAALFRASIVSVDSITDISWTFPGGSPATSNNRNVNVLWNDTGSYNVQLSVTNLSGTSTATMTVDVFAWNWDDEMSYCGNGGFISGLQLNASSDIEWGIRFPAQYMSGRNYLNYVSAYINTPGNYELKVFQGGQEAPQSLIYSHTYSVNESNQWHTFPVYDLLHLDTNANLWITFHTDSISYPASYTGFSGDMNGSLINFQGTWIPIQSISSSINPTWMIKATTSSHEPDLSISIVGPDNGQPDESIVFSALGPDDASYSWFLEGASPATATGQHVMASWSNTGTYTVTVIATRHTATDTASMLITIHSCDYSPFPYVMGFEENQSLDCWTFLDEDGDGHGWILNRDNNSPFCHTGSGALMSASFINTVGALRPDNWAITPKVTIPESGASIEWWGGAVDASYHNDYYSVLVSTSDTRPSSFTDTLFSGPNESGDFTKHSRSLNEYAGQDIHIAFRHHNCRGIFWLSIDDIRISSDPAAISAVNTPSIDFYPNPTNYKLYLSEPVLEVSVVDINGRVIMSHTNTRVIDLTNLNNGVYFVQVITDKGTASKKIVKK